MRQRYMIPLALLAMLGFSSASIAQQQKQTPQATPTADDTVRQGQQEPINVGNESSDQTRGRNDLRPGETINLNTASVEQIERIPNIGPALARAIVDWREQKCANMPKPCVAFHKVEDLDEVPNIGPRRMKMIGQYATTEEIQQNGDVVRQRGTETLAPPRQQRQ